MSLTECKTISTSSIPEFKISLKRKRSWWHATVVALLFLGVSDWVSAQPVYQASDFANSGDGQLVSTAYAGLYYLDFTTTGEGYQWDYSNLRVSTQLEVAYIDPYLAGYKNSWCLLHNCFSNCKETFKTNFNLALAKVDSIRLGDFALSNVVDHYHRSDATLEARMIGGTFLLNGTPLQIIVDYTNADTIYQFPLVYGQEDHSTGQYVIDLNKIGIDLTFSSNTKRINRVVGWGSLKTPSTTYPSVLKMQTTLIRNDTLTTNGISHIRQDTLIQYKWFDPNFKIPVLQANGQIAGKKIRITEATYFGSFSCLPPKSSFSYLPLAPVFDGDSESSEIFFSNLSINADSFYWAFDDGAHYNNINVVHTYTNPGIKHVSLKVYNTRCNPIVADSFSMPVLLVDTSTTRVYQQTVTICEGDSIFLERAFQKQDGIYYDTLSSAKGYDSLMITKLIIYQIKTGLSSRNTTINVHELNGSYQWLECGEQLQPIPGATGPVYAPDHSGSYAAIIEKFGCLDTTACYSMITSAISDQASKHSIRVYPNITHDFIQIELKEIQPKLLLKLFSMDGILVHQQSFIDKKELQLDLSNFPNGMYLLVVSKPGSPHQLPIKVVKY